MAEDLNQTSRHRSALTWIRVSLVVIFVWVIVWLLLPRGSFVLVAFSNVSGFVLIVAMLVRMVRNALRSKNNARTFWWLMASGTLCWAVTQGAWVYFEVLRRVGVPDLFWGDFILFLHLIPMMVAAAGQPHAKRDLRKASHQSLDQILLAFWWIFLYLVTLAPWELVKLDPKAYSFSYNVLYAIELFAVMIGFGMLYRRSRGAWHTLYQRFFVAAVVYTVGSLTVNVVLDLAKGGLSYYTGDLYDIPWVVGLLVWTWAVYRSGDETEQLSSEQDDSLPTSRISWSATFSTAAALTTPVMALYIVLSPSQAPEIDTFRLFAILHALIFITISVFIKQWALNRALVRSLAQSRDAYCDLQKMQAQLLETEKLVSIGRLVAGAAHEINNPLTAIVGYSDLMVTDDSVKQEHRDFAQKILQQARRTKSLVQNLLAFSRQSPLQRAASDINAVALGAVQLLLIEHRNHSIQTHTELSPGLPPILVDRGQITQAFLHIMNHATDFVVESGSAGSITIRTWLENGSVMWSCAATGSPSAEGTMPAPGFRLSASHSMIQDQGGRLGVDDVSGEGPVFVVSLPAAAAIPAEAVRASAAHS